MKNFILPVILLLCVSTKAKCQLIADPALEQVFFSDLSGTPIDDTMPLGYIARLNVPVRNLNVQNGIPAGSCKLKIGLGSKMNLAPGFNLSQANTGNYFNWFIENTGGQWQLTGDLIATIPPGYSDTARFNVQGIVLGYSTITANFLVTNHNTTVIASDENPGNNSSFRLYKIIPADPIPVRFTGLHATENNCTIAVDFTVENETNLSHYEAEYSVNNDRFTSAGIVRAENRLRYSLQFPVPTTITTTELYLRIKSVDHDGSSRYSITRHLNLRCNRHETRWSVFPNPVQRESLLKITCSGQILQGPFRLELFDARGSRLASTIQSARNASQLQYPIAGLPSGNYLLKLSNDNGTIRQTLRFIKQ